MPVEKMEIFLNTESVYMKQNVFQYKNEFDKVKHGTNIGNHSIEKQLKEENALPNNWTRNVNDVFATVQRIEFLVLTRIDNRIDISIYTKNLNIQT